MTLPWLKQLDITSQQPNNCTPPTCSVNWLTVTIPDELVIVVGWMDSKRAYNALIGGLFHQHSLTTFGGYNTRPVWSAEQIRDVDVDLEDWNQAFCNYHYCCEEDRTFWIPRANLTEVFLKTSITLFSPWQRLGSITSSEKKQKPEATEHILKWPESTECCRTGAKRWTELKGPIWLLSLNPNYWHFDLVASLTYRLKVLYLMSWEWDNQPSYKLDP